jgi:hypothetical protein
MSRDHGERLRLIRERLHEIPSQRQFAFKLGVEPARYNHWEKGWPIPVDQAEKIKKITPGITGDYIFWGDETGLTVGVWRKLRSRRTE